MRPVLFLGGFGLLYWWAAKNGYAPNPFASVAAPSPSTPAPSSTGTTPAASTHTGTSTAAVTPGFAPPQIQDPNPNFGAGTMTDNLDSLSIAKAAASRSAVNGIPGDYKLSPDQWNWWWSNTTGKAPADAGGFPYPAGQDRSTPITATQYHDYLEAVGWESPRRGMGNYFSVPGGEFVDMWVN